MALRPELHRATPELQQAVSALPSNGFICTSVIDGPHVKGSAHFDGKAIDFGGHVGRNKESWDFLSRAIMSRKFTKIGTELSLIEDPALRSLAEQYGVELFQDDKHTGATGPHFHLQVP